MLPISTHEPPVKRGGYRFALGGQKAGHHKAAGHRPQEPKSSAVKMPTLFSVGDLFNLLPVKKSMYSWS